MASNPPAEGPGAQTIPASDGGNPKIWIDIGLVTLCVIWGVNFSVIKVALAEIEPLAFNAFRFSLAAVTLFALLRWRGPIPLPHADDRVRIVFLGLLSNLVYQLFFIFGIDATLAGNASLVLATTPVWTLVLATILGQEQHSMAVWVGVLATLGGMVFVVAGGAGATGYSGGLPRGDLLLVGAAVTWSVYTVGTQDLARRYGALAVTSWTLWVGTVGIVVAGASSVARMDLGSVSLMAWVGVAYSGILAIAIAYLLWNVGLEHIGSARTAVFSNLVPVVALVTATLWLGERFSIFQLVGAAVIIGGVWLARVARTKEGLPAAMAANPSNPTRASGDAEPRETRTR
jgi:drug/metabolite transporter (DMT)-like permease